MSRRKTSAMGPDINGQTSLIMLLSECKNK